MVGHSPSAKSSVTSRHLPAWLPLAAVSILLIVVPTAVYLFFYRASRIESATVRNLRALDAAADRVEAVMSNLPGVVVGSSFGVSVTMLDELTERLTGRKTRHLTLPETGCGDDNTGISAEEWSPDAALHDFQDLLRSYRPAQPLRLEFRYQIAVHLLSESNRATRGETKKLWNELYCLLKKHRRYSSPVETIEVDVNPLSRIPLRSLPSLPFRNSISPPLIPYFASYYERCGGVSNEECRNWLESEGCPNSTQSTQLGVGGVTVTDCRPLRERHRDLHDALHAWLKSEGCPNSTQSTQLGVGGVTVTDCRPLRERHRDLHDALHAWGETDQTRVTEAAKDLIRVIDLFGVRSTAGLHEFLTNATGYLSRFFDSHLIADSKGRILFQAEASPDSGTETDESQVATPAFSNHVDISALLRVSSARLPDGGNGTPTRSRPSSGDDGAAVPSSASSLRSESFVQRTHIDNIELRMFVHPFILNNVDISDDSEQNSPEGRGSSNRFYIVGIVDGKEFASAAIRLRLSLVINATLIVFVLLTLCPLLWFWTTGDRSTIGRWKLAGVCATPVVGVVLFVVLACGMVTNRIDKRVLDDTMEKVADRVVSLFDWELHKKIVDLHHRARNYNDTPDNRPGKADDTLQRAVAGGSGGAPQPDVDRLGKLNKLEKTFYCDQSDRGDPNYDPQDPQKDYQENLFLIDENGRQATCLNSGRLTRTPKLDLEFREYFKQPKEGALWRPGRAAPPREACRTRDATDRASLIPCLIPRSRESWGLHAHEPRPGSTPATLASTLVTYLPDRVRSVAARLVDLLIVPNSGEEVPNSGEEVPYFLDRIDSVVLGDVRTVLAIRTECGTATKGDCANTKGDWAKRPPVAAIGVRLNSLDWAVPPPHVDLAVVDRRTGRTLFHSDDDLAMTTNFAEDVGGDPALWSLLHAGAPDTISLVYAGIPVRAHVRPLREGMPWALIVYRGHELEDRLALATTVLAAFFTLLPLLCFTLLFGAVLFVAYLCGCPSIASFPICLGRVMATGSGSGRGGSGSSASGSPAAQDPFNQEVSRTPSGTLPRASRKRPADVVAKDGSGRRRMFGAVTGLALAFLVWNVPLLARWLFPSLAVGSVIAVFLFLAWRVRQTTSSNGDEAGAVRHVLVVSLVIVFLGAAPAGLWFSHHRAELGAGLNHYLADRTQESIDQAREEYGLQMLREYGGGIADRDDSTSPQPYVERVARRPGESWIYAQLLDLLRPLVGLSRLSSDLMRYRVFAAGPPRDVTSLHGVFDTTFDYDLPGRYFGHVFLESVVWLFLAAALIGFIVHSIRTIVAGPTGTVVIQPIRTIVTQRPRRLEKLRDANHLLEEGKKPLSAADPRLPAVVLCRDPKSREDFIKKLTGKSGEDSETAVFHCARRHARTDGNIVRWEMDGQCRENETLYVFDELETVLEDSANGRALFAELERRVDGGSAVLVWATVAHHYRYSERFGPVEKWFGSGLPDGADRRRRWSRLADRLKGYAYGSPNLPWPGITGSKELRELWNESTFDERLELYALACGGVTNSWRPTALETLSSLGNRGIVKVDRMGVAQWSCEKFGRMFGEFILRDVNRQELLAWQKEGRGGLWRVIWPPVLIGAALVLAFLFFANPEMRSILWLSSNECG